MRTPGGIFSRQFTGTILLLVATATSAKLADDRSAEQLAKPLETISREMAGFAAKDNPALTDGVLGQLKPTSYLSRTYQKLPLSVDVFVAYYAQQRAGESMHSPKHCLPGAGWEIWEYGAAELELGGRTVKVNNYSISRDGQRMVVLYWYQSKERIFASEYFGKLLLAWDALRRSSTAGSIVRVIANDDPDSVAAARAIAASLISQVELCLRG
jgi:EpsI family protein